MTVINNRVSTLMGERRLSVRRLATETGLSYTTAYGMYSGRTTRYDADVLDKLCEYFGVGVGELLQYVPNQKEGE